MLTKGDVLKAMGAVKSAYGSAEKLVTDILGPSGKRASEVSLLGGHMTPRLISSRRRPRRVAPLRRRWKRL